MNSHCELLTGVSLHLDLFEAVIVACDWLKRCSSYRAVASVVASPAAESFGDVFFRHRLVSDCVGLCVCECDRYTGDLVAEVSRGRVSGEAWCGDAEVDAEVLADEEDDDDEDTVRGREGIGAHRRGHHIAVVVFHWGFHRSRLWGAGQVVCPGVVGRVSHG